MKEKKENARERGIAQMVRRSCSISAVMGSISGLDVLTELVTFGSLHVNVVCRLLRMARMCPVNYSIIKEVYWNFLGYPKKVFSLSFCDGMEKKNSIMSILVFSINLINIISWSFTSKNNHIDNPFPKFYVYYILSIIPSIIFL